MTQYVFAGSSSGTGHAVLRRLVEKVGAENLTCLVRHSSDVSPHQELRVKTVIADVTDPTSFEKLLDLDTIFIDMTHPKHYHISLNTLQNSKTKRAFFVTTTGVFSSYNQFSEIYKINEEKIRSSGITYTILRPSMIYGHTRDRNMSRLIGFLSKYPMFPLFSDGTSLMQPVFVDDLADGIVAAIVSSNSANNEYNLCGPEPISYKKLVQSILEMLDRNVYLLNIPFELAKLGAKIGSYIPKFPVTVEQVLRLQEDKVFDISKSVSELGYSPRSFEQGIKLEIDSMRNQGLL